MLYFDFTALLRIGNAIVLLLVISIVLCCCEGKKHNTAREYGKKKTHKFNQDCKKTFHKRDIPKAALELLNKYCGEEFKIANPDEYQKVNLTDAIISNDTVQIYNKILNFVLLCGKECIISFKKGGFVRTDVIAHFSGEKLAIYYVPSNLKNKEDIERYLAICPEPEKIIY